MKKVVKSLVLKKMEKCKISELKYEDNYAVVELTEKFNGNYYITLKSRESKRRIKSKINGNVAKFDLDNVLNLADGNVYDFYITLNMFGLEVSRRVKNLTSMSHGEVILEKNRMCISTYSTVYNNLSMLVRDNTYGYKVLDIKSIGEQIMFRIQIAENTSDPVERLTLLFAMRESNKVFGFDLFRENQTSVFTGYVFPEKLTNDININERWDVSLKVVGNNNKELKKELIYLDNYVDLSNEENRYLRTSGVIEALENEEADETQLIFVPYITDGKNSLALWYTDIQQFRTTYTIKRGLTIYKELIDKPADEKMIFFESFLGKNYSGNPKYIYEYMISDNRFKDFTFVWSYSGENKEVIKGNPIVVNRNSQEYYEYFAKSKYWVSNIIFPIKIKRNDNVYIQTWHGTPLKRLAYDIDITGPETLARENLYIESRNWDYLIAANDYSEEIFKRAFKFDKKMLTTGYPLNDVFYRNDVDELIVKFKQGLNIPLNKKVVLYAPTWRDNNSTSSWNYDFDVKLDLEAMKNKLGDDYCVLLRMHHLISENLEISEDLGDFVYDVSKYDDVQELYLISDILITDYSSVFFDYANTKRPILFYAYDFDDYKDNIRGFYLDMHKDLPGPVIEKEEDLIDAIINIDEVEKEYTTKYNEFFDRFCSLEDGQAAKRVIDSVFGGNK